MAAVSTLKITTGFADDTKRDLEIGPFAPTATAISNIKANIAQVNENISDIADYYVSDDGASATGIIAAQIITVNEREINLNDD